jgi:uncharacterized Zn finger protein (UPF0148 family)
MTDKTCERCKSPIVGRRSHARYCCEQCQSNALKRRSYRRNRDAVLAERSEEYKSDPVRRFMLRVQKLALKHVPAQPCSQCGAAKAERHHHDYSKPLDVVFLCRRCHTIWHREHGHGHTLAAAALDTQHDTTTKEQAS